jgi:acyl-CoA reductase-like NAD-dependent aldehyde dehydrogenase
MSDHLLQVAFPTKLTLPEHRDAYYGGKWHAPKDGHYVDTINPGTGESLDKVADCGAADMDVAIASAKAAFKHWRRVPPLERARSLKRVAQIECRRTRHDRRPIAAIQSRKCWPMPRSRLRRWISLPGW